MKKLLKGPEATQLNGRRWLKKRAFLWYYLIAFGIPITLMAAIIFFPYPLKLIHGGPVDLGEIFESAHEQTGLDGAETLIPSIRLFLAEPVLWLVNIWALSPTIAIMIHGLASDQLGFSGSPALGRIYDTPESISWNIAYSIGALLVIGVAGKNLGLAEEKPESSRVGVSED